MIQMYVKIDGIHCRGWRVWQAGSREELLGILGRIKVAHPDWKIYLKEVKKNGY